MDVHGARDAENRNVIAWPRHNGLNQRWTVVYLDTIKEPTIGGYSRTYGFWINRPFYIQTRLGSKRVVEAAGGRNLVLKTRTNRNNQQFVFDAKTKTIKCVAYRDRSFDI